MNKQSSKRGRLIPFTQNAEYFFQRALTYYHQNNLIKAKKFLLRAVQIDNEEPVYICQLAAVLAELGEFDESNKWLQYIVTEVDPTLAECHFFLANNYVHLGQFEKAEEEALTYLEADPEGEFVEDAEDLLYFIGAETPTANEENIIIQKHIAAKKKMEEGRFTEAIDLFKRMIEEHPHFWAAYNNLALAYFYVNKKEEALKTLDTVLTKNPGNLHAICNLALFTHFLGFKDKSKRIIEQLKKIYPIHEEHRYKLGSTFALLHEHEYAYRWLSSLDKTKLESEIPYYHWLAVSAFQTNRLRVAKQAWQHIERIDEETGVASYYLKKLEENSLTRSQVDYQYRIPREDSSYAEILAEGLKGDERSKLVHLLILRKNFNQQAYDTLKKFCQAPNETLYLKELAAYIMLHQAAQLPVLINHEGLEIIYNDVTQLPKSVVTGVRVIERLQRHVPSGYLNDIVYRLWSVLFKYAYEYELKFTNEKGWAAAVEYIALKHESGQTQKDVAKKYHISLATVQYYIKKIKMILEHS